MNKFEQSVDTPVDKYEPYIKEYQAQIDKLQQRMDKLNRQLEDNQLYSKLHQDLQEFDPAAIYAAALEVKQADDMPEQQRESIFEWILSLYKLQIAKSRLQAVKLNQGYEEVIQQDGVEGYPYAICASCGKEIKKSPYSGKGISHGICANCVQVELTYTKLELL